MPDGPREGSWESEEHDLSQTEKTFATIPDGAPSVPEETPNVSEKTQTVSSDGQDEAQEYAMGLTAQKAGMPELEPGTWIYDYVSVHEPLTDAPLQYHAAMGWGILSCILTGQFYLHFQGEKLHPNLWVIIVGPPGTSRKSTCLKFAKRVISQARRGIQLSERFSTEGLIMELGMLKDDGLKGGLSVLNEFSLLLTLLDRDFASGSAEILCSLYDGAPVSYATKKDGRAFIEEMPLSMLGATTVQSINQSVGPKRAAIMRGGFWSRICPVVFNGTPEKALPMPPNPNQEKYDQVIRSLSRLALLEGQCALSLDAVKIYKNFYYDIQKEASKSQSDMITSVIARQQIVALKIAICQEVQKIPHGEDPKSVVISGSSMETGNAWSSFFLSNAISLLGTVSETDFESKAEKVMQFIRDYHFIQDGKPCAPLREIYRKFKMKVKDMQDLLQSLESGGYIEFVEMEGRTKGPKKMLIALKK